MTSGFAALLMAVGFGALSQRITGLGFALVAGPIAVLVLGGWEGVLLVNVIGLYVCGTAWWAGRTLVDVRAAITLSLWGTLGAIPGSVLAAAVPAQILDIVVGITIIVALTSVLLLRRPFRRNSGANQAVSGTVAGLMNAAAGTPGPPLTVHAASVRMPHANFAATVQPVFVVLGVVTIMTKLLTAPGAFVALEPWQWALCVVTPILGVAGGTRIGRYVPEAVARAMTFGLAYAGAFSTLARGIGVL